MKAGEVISDEDGYPIGIFDGSKVVMEAGQTFQITSLKVGRDHNYDKAKELLLRSIPIGSEIVFMKDRDSYEIAAKDVHGNSYMRHVGIKLDDYYVRMKVKVGKKTFLVPYTSIVDNITKVLDQIMPSVNGIENNFQSPLLKEFFDTNALDLYEKVIGK